MFLRRAAKKLGKILAWPTSTASCNAGIIFAALIVSKTTTSDTWFSATDCRIIAFGVSGYPLTWI